MLTRNQMLRGREKIPMWSHRGLTSGDSFPGPVRHHLITRMLPLTMRGSLLIRARILHGTSGRYYECACKRGLRRRIKQVRTPNDVRFQVHQKGKHDHVAPARRKNQRNTRAQLDAVRNAPPSLTPQQILLTRKDLELDARRIRAIKSADTRKIRTKDWKT